MPPTPPKTVQEPPRPTVREDPVPRIITYAQTHYHNGSYVSLLPLLYEKTGITHIIIAAIHLNEDPGNITLNDDPFEAPKHAVLWEEVRTLQKEGIKVLGMLGGAAKGTYRRLDGGTISFEAFYGPLRDRVRKAGLDGLDLDVEEEMSLAGIVRLIDRLKADFGPGYVITMAPVASALWGGKHLSGFHYGELEKAMGRHIAWYNAQFYCGWASAETTEHYDTIVASGWDPKKVVLGLVTNPGNGDGWVFEDLLMATLSVLKEKHQNFGGVMGWEYFNAITDTDRGQPWLWVGGMKMVLKREEQDGVQNENDYEIV